MEILQSMNSATDVTVTIERNGQTSQISINNAQVAAEAAAAAAVPEASRSMRCRTRPATTSPRSDDEDQPVATA